MRILTFNWHEAYLCMLAATRQRFDVVEREKGGRGAWFYETRPLPANLRLVKAATARDSLRRGQYDAVICHNLKDLRETREYRVPRVLVCHNMLGTELALAGSSASLASEQQRMGAELASAPGTEVVFISEAKRESWGLPGRVILPGIDLEAYQGYEGAEPRVLRVGNFMKARDVMMGYYVQRAVLGDLPSTLLGLNEPEPGARFSASWEDLKACFRRHRVYLNTTVRGFEDGYNLAMLEAMATGMPVVSTSNPSSPLEDGTSGFVSDDPAVLRAAILSLLDDLPLARRMGQAARAAVAERFPMARFVAEWLDVLEGCQRRRSRLPAPSSRVVAEPVASGPARKRVLLSYVSYPATTARYIEASLRKTHEVVTIGPRMDEGTIAAWNLQAMKERPGRHDLETGWEFDVSQVVDAIASRFAPDLFLWVESVGGINVAGIPRLPCATACYLIDTHLNLPWHKEHARRFDHVFVAQRQYVDDLRRAGCPRVSWLPLGCDPAVHAATAPRKLHEIAFVGSLAGHEVRRQRLARLSARVPVHVERSFLSDMARTFAASRIVFNDAVAFDLNMRVFEALASGTCLLTDRAEGSGLDELFLDRRHLVIYDDATLEELAEYYLAHDEEREAIAAAGKEEVLRWHTYDARVRVMLARVFEPAAPGGRAALDDERRLGVNDDPLLDEAFGLLGERRFDDCLERLGHAERGRELTAPEQLARHDLAAQCLSALGRGDQARQVAEHAKTALTGQASLALAEFLAG